MAARWRLPMPCMLESRIGRVHRLSRVAGLVFILVFVGFLGTTSANAEDEDDLFHLGLIEYELSCLPCHGLNGRGDGPDAKYLTAQPSDLTGITKSNGGIFPSEELALTIDGRAIVAAHGIREMPVWGQRYRMPIPGENGEWNIEREAHTRIDALVRYIKTLQEQY